MYFASAKICDSSYNTLIKGSCMTHTTSTKSAKYIYIYSLAQSAKVSLALLLLAITFFATSQEGLGQPNSSCVPDCLNEPFYEPDPIDINLTPDCIVRVWYSYRTACQPPQHDLQIRSIMLLGPNCSSANIFPLTNLFNSVYKEIIRMNPMNFPPNGIIPNPPGIKCYDQFRVTQASCFAKYVTITPPPNSSEIETIMPCIGTSCCLQRIKICRDINNNVEIIPFDTAITSGIPSCSQAIPYSGFGTASVCQTVCNSFQFVTKFDNDSNKGLIKNTINMEPHKLVTLNNKNFEFEVISPQNITYTIFISDLNGNVLNKTNGNFVEGKNQVKLDLSNFENGKYLISVLANNFLISSYKISLEN
jgi:hypothetical protein